MTLVYWSAERDKPWLPWFPRYGKSKNRPINQWLIWWSAIFSFTYLNWYWTAFCLLQLLKIFFDSSSTNPKTDFQLVFDCNNCFNWFYMLHFSSSDFQLILTGFRLVFDWCSPAIIQLNFNWYSTATTALTGIQLIWLDFNCNIFYTPTTGLWLVFIWSLTANSWKTVEKQSKANEYEMNTDEKKQW